MESSMTDRAAPEFMIQRRFAAPIDRVFDAWADPVQMARWSGPEGSRVTVLSGRIDAGETLHARSDAADGAVLFTLCRYLTVDRPSHLVYDQSFADEAGHPAPCPFFDAWPATLRTDIRFEQQDGGTNITLRWMPINASAAELASFIGAMESMTGGWGGSFDKLDLYLAA
jgi:uncharacterized protein YndB with AHSA1/START domain